MTTFTDAQDRVWKLQLDVVMLEDFKAHGVDVDDLFQDSSKLAVLFMTKPAKLVEIFYIACEDQVKERGMTEREFGKMFTRDTLDKAANALIQEIICFFQRGATDSLLKEKIPSLLKEMDNLIVEKLKGQLELSSIAMKSGALSESAPAPVG